MSKTDIRIAASCMDTVEPAYLPVDGARRLILEAVQPVAQTETIALRDSLGRVLAEDVRSHIDVPPHTNSAMDGYALRGDDLSQGQRRFTLIGSALAGRPYGGKIESGQGVRIMTGAPMPAGADTVVIQERAELNGNTLRIGEGDRPGQNVRQAGEDIRADEIVLGAGQRLMPAEMGLLGSLGTGKIKVRRRVRVAFFSTGDEIRSIGESPGEPLPDGMLYDSNRYTLLGMLQRLGAETLDLGVVKDDPKALREAYAKAGRSADAVITSGGVSVGEADYVKQILAESGAIDFWQVAMKPGRPLAFGRILSSSTPGAHFFGLPGNPVAAMVCFYQFVQPALHRLMGERGAAPATLTARCQSRLKKKPGRTEFQRGRLITGEDGEIAVSKTGRQGSGILSSMMRANCFIVLPADCGEIEPGTPVEVQPFFGLV